MAHNITDSCISCGACEDICQSGAISEGTDRYVIDAAKCTDCGECADNCAQEAIIGERK
jgi:ferredoxin